MSTARATDIFCKAIRLLPPEVREKAAFLFVGKAADKGMMDAVGGLTATTRNVFYRKRLARTRSNPDGAVHLRGLCFPG